MKLEATLTCSNIIKTLNRISENMSRTKGRLGAQQGMSDLDSMVHIAGADNTGLARNFKEELVMVGIDSRNDILANLDNAIISYAHHHEYNLAIRHAKEAQKVSDSNCQWFNYDLTKHSGLRHYPATVNRVQKIIDGLKLDYVK